MQASSKAAIGLPWRILWGLFAIVTSYYCAGVERGQANNPREWEHFHGMPDDISIRLTIRPGSLIGTYFVYDLNGRGTGTITRKAKWDPSHKPATIDTLAYSTEAFLQLLNHFYELEFFDMPENQLHRFRLKAEQSGEVSVVQENCCWYDTTQGELKVQIGESAKSVVLPLDEFAAPPLLDVVNKVQAFADSSVKR